MDKKYQIFISSTYEDLKDERNEVIKAILEMGHLPVGMEMFSAGDEEQWEVIKKQIEQSDYYIVIAAHRYGSLDGEISYTEKEYDYAKSLGIPILGFIIEDNAHWPSNKVCTEPETVEKITRFKQKIQTKLVNYWKNKEHLYGQIAISLTKQFNTNPRSGWIKSTDQNSSEILSEVSRLSKENSELKKQINSLQLQQNESENTRIKETLTLLKKKFSISFYYQKGKDWENEREITLYQIFELLAPELMIEASVEQCSRYLGQMLNPDNTRPLRSIAPIPDNVLNLILADLSLLEIIVPSPKKHQIKDDKKYWAISTFGHDIYTFIKKTQMYKEIESTTAN